MNMFKKNGGFTLVELIVVIAILAILAGVAIPAYSGYIEKAQDAAVITELDAIQTAAQAANATAGTLTSIAVETDETSTTITVTAAKLADGYIDDFEMFYTGAEAAANEVVTDGSVEFSIAKVILEGSYKDGATWYPSKAADNSHVAGWNKG